MKIREVRTVVETNFYLDVEGTDYPTFRRSMDGDWENLMGESWEPVYLQSKTYKELESQFQFWIINVNVKDLSQESQNPEDLSGQRQETPESK